MVAIEVKYIGPTNHRGSRYKAFTESQELTLNANYSYNPEENAAGSTKTGWVFVFMDGEKY